MHVYTGLVYTRVLNLSLNHILKRVASMQCKGTFPLNRRECLPEILYVANSCPNHLRGELVSRPNRNPRGIVSSHALRLTNQFLPPYSEGKVNGYLSEIYPRCAYFFYDSTSPRPCVYIIKHDSLNYPKPCQLKHHRPYLSP